jgi:hypothetical protein
MRIPTLIKAKASLEAAIWFHENADMRLSLMDDAMKAIEAAIEAVNGAKEDAHRMEGRANVDTELLEELA